MTLLTVNYYSDDDVARLVKSFHAFVSDNFPAVVVANTPFRRQLRTRVVTAGVNLHHGLGLDFGLRFVSTEYVLICDPDSILLSPSFWPEMKRRVDAYGAASIDIGQHDYHPICLAFRTELWKTTRLSMREDWEHGHDVAGNLTVLLGGARDEARLPRTRSAGPAIQASLPGKCHYVGEVYADLFSNTLGASRVLEGSDAFGVEEGSVEYIRGYHERWRAWADSLLAGAATLDDFPSE